MQMTIKELYEWAEINDATDLTIVVNNEYGAPTSYLELNTDLKKKVVYL